MSIEIERIRKMQADGKKSKPVSRYKILIVIISLVIVGAIGGYVALKSKKNHLSSSAVIVPRENIASQGEVLGKDSVKKPTLPQSVVRNISAKKPGFGPGNSSGYGGGTGYKYKDVKGLIGDLDKNSKSFKLRGSLSVLELKIVKGETLTGGRSRSRIMRVIWENHARLRYAYNKRLKGRPGLQGKVVLKFTIDPKGNVDSCMVDESTIKDPEFEKIIVKNIKEWVFEKVDDKIGTTEVVCPFTFTQNLDGKVVF